MPKCFIFFKSTPKFMCHNLVFVFSYKIYKKIDHSLIAITSEKNKDDSQYFFPFFS